MLSSHFTGNLKQFYGQPDGALLVSCDSHEELKVSYIQIEQLGVWHEDGRGLVLLNQPVVVLIQVNLNLLEQWLAHDVDRNLGVQLEHKNEVLEQIFSLFQETVALDEHVSQNIIDHGSELLLFLAEVIQQTEEQVVRAGSESRRL